MAFCEDELFQILSWLPAKSLCKFKSACGWTLNFSKETYFCMKNAQNMLLQDDTGFFIQQDNGQRFSGRIESHSFNDEELLSSGVPQDFLSFLAKSAKIISSSNGLALCRSTSRESEVELFLCNPVMKTWLPVATPASVHEFPDVAVDVVFQCMNDNLDVDDYRITLIDGPLEWSSYRDLKVYSPKEGVWEAMEKSFFIGSRNMRFDMPVTLNNSLHIISDSSPSFTKSSPFFRPYIMAYNYESGESTMLRLPRDARRGSHDDSCNMGIFEWGKAKSSDHSICLVRYRKRVFTVWILEDYKSTLWRRVLKIRVKAMGLKEEDPRVEGFAVMNGDCLIFATEKKVYAYNLSGGKHLQRAKEICEHGLRGKVYFTSYSNTLRPCGTGATTFHG
ncbi:uncharacterized protein LOC130719007 [Lotus japonicus]|uniref:uncharacterized protein LOC130719007 n=1 Tax=Lotus japonicus TaxID=34305 RepID=UPI0025893A31|nr:uncharacterized protein LOC130719007 [Lotus japonicus]